LPAPRHPAFADVYLFETASMILAARSTKNADFAVKNRALQGLALASNSVLKF